MQDGDNMSQDGAPFTRGDTLLGDISQTFGYSYGFAYCNRTMRKEVPKRHLPDHPLPANVVKTLIEDELVLDGNPRQNLASFVTTYMEKEAEELMMEAAKKNAIDVDEYSQTAELQKRSLNMIARLWNAPLDDTQDATGTATVGSSEAIMLAVLAMKWRWRARQKARGRPHDKPNLVMGANAQICWKKAMKYFEVEDRFAPVSPDCLVLTAERARVLMDENTIGVCPILGSTFNGEYEDVEAIHDMVAEVNAQNDWAIPLHVDAASGGFIAPFIQPDLLWDFRLPWVKSINASGHKFGLVLAGIGWLAFRESEDLHDDLVFHVNYLGGDQASLTLNFSRGASQIVGQYYNFLRLGRLGYKEIMTNAMENASYLRQALVATGKVDIVDKAHMPLVAFSLKGNPVYTVFEIQDKLRERGWIVPAYTCCHGAESLAIMRVVVKENFSRDLAESLVEDFKKAVAYLQKDHDEQADLLKQAQVQGHEAAKAQGADSAAVGAKRPAELMSVVADNLIKRVRRVRNLGHGDRHRGEAKTTTGIC